MNKNFEEKKLQEITKKEEILITFIRKTQNGDYAPIETSSLPQSRAVEERLDIGNYAEYFYSIT